MNGSSERDLGVLLFEAGLAAIYLGALVYIAGWSYADTYFALLGLNLTAIQGFGTENFYGFAFWVFKDVWLVASAAIVAVTAGLIVMLRSINQVFASGVWAGLLVAAALAGLLAAEKLGTKRAEAQMRVLFSEDYQTFQRIRVIAQSGTSLATFFNERGGLGDSTCLRKLMMDQSHLYAYAGYEATKDGVPTIMVFRLDDIAVLETVANRSLC